MSTTVLQQQHVQVSQDQTCVDKIIVRVESKRSNKVFGNFTLRDINTEVVNYCEEVIREQLKEDIVNHSFYVGYVQGTKVVCIRSRLHLQEFWQNFKKSSLV